MAHLQNQLSSGVQVNLNILLYNFPTILRSDGIKCVYFLLLNAQKSKCAWNIFYLELGMSVLKN